MGLSCLKLGVKITLYKFSCALANLLTTDPSKSDSVDTVLDVIARDMAQVDAVIAHHLSSDVPLIGQISQYMISAGGKRLRPALLLLMSGAVEGVLGRASPHKFQMAAVVEFIHTATLLHDDVVDQSSMRRGRPTANQAFGNAASVLVGDFLYSRAFQMMMACSSMRVLSILSDATNVIAEGEVLQLMSMHDASLTEQAYLNVIRSKTAKLFEASARIATVLAGAAQTTEQACACYGQALGTAFQVIDDALDYEGDADRMGKNLGDDLREGKVTLPLIVAMQRGTSAEAEMIRRAIEPSQSDTLDKRLASILAIIQRTRALEATHAAARAQCQCAIAALDVLPNSIYKSALIKLAQNSLTRTA
jgi:octaprenyl-diphosphate synthase